LAEDPDGDEEVVAEFPAAVAGVLAELFTGEDWAFAFPGRLVEPAARSLVAGGLAELATEGAVKEP